MYIYKNHVKLLNFPKKRRMFLLTKLTHESWVLTKQQKDPRVLCEINGGNKNSPKK